MQAIPLTEEQLADFRRDGWLLVRGALDAARVDALRDAVDQAAGWADLGVGLHHFEQTDAGPRIARSEDLIPHHEGLRGFICAGPMIAWTSALFGEPARLFKEKVNYKHPGGGGFAPHQDAAAYRFVDHHISCMVPLDPATTASGCLYVAPGYRGGMMPTDARGCVEAAHAAGLDWRSVEVFPGDALWFDSYTPHYSETNRTGAPRRALYLTYNAASDGDFRAIYYADKRAQFVQSDDASADRVRISVTDDFLGRPVPRASKAPIEALFKRFSGPFAEQIYDEAITERAHALQAAECAAAEGASPALIAAALLHDIGHFLIGDLFPIDQPLPRDFKHEEVGARYLARWFGPDVTRPVALHVTAKRYLITTDDAYRATLSPSSLRSLEVQGGAMSDAERAAFQSDPHWEGAVALRRWDDLAKEPTVTTRDFDAFEPMLRDLAGAATA